MYLTSTSRASALASFDDLSTDKASASFSAAIDLEFSICTGIIPKTIHNDKTIANAFFFILFTLSQNIFIN